LNLTYPPLKPASIASNSPEDNSSFKVTPSLGSTPSGGSSDAEYGVATTATNTTSNAAIVDTSSIHKPRPTKTSSLREQMSRSSSINNMASAPSKYSLPAPGPAQRRAISGHIGAQKNGSPISRRPVASPMTPGIPRGNRSSNHGYDALSARGQHCLEEAQATRSENATMPKQADFTTYMALSGTPIEQDSPSGASTEFHFTEQSDSHHNNSRKSSSGKSTINSRRSSKYGYSVRFSNDAHEYIMGEPSSTVVSTNFGGADDRADFGHSGSIQIQESGTTSHHTASGHSCPTLQDASRPGDSSKKIREIKVRLSTPNVGISGTGKNRESFIVSAFSTATHSDTSRYDHVPKKRRVAKQAELDQVKQASLGAKKVYREAGIKPPSRAPPLPPRSSSLPNSPAFESKVEASTPVPHTPVPQQPTVSRLLHPTVASAARASKTSLLQRGKQTFRATASTSSVNKGTVSTSNTKAAASTSAIPLRKSGTLSSFNKVSKGIKSRFTSMIPGRRTHHILKSSTESDHERDSKSPESVVDSDPLDYHHHRRAVSRNLTTYEDSGMEMNTSGAIRTYSSRSLNFTEPEPTDEVASERSQADRQAWASPSEAYVEANAIRGAQQQFNQQYGHAPGGSGDEPPTPPPTRDGPAGHYAEEEGQVDTYDESNISTFLDGLLGGARERLDYIIDISRNTTDPRLREATLEVAQHLGDAITASRNARIATLRLNRATAELTQYTAEVAARTTGIQARSE
jgi:hypothetical protein